MRLHPPIVPEQSLWPFPGHEKNFARHTFKRGRGCDSGKRNPITMLWTLFVVLLLAWLVCVIVLKTVGLVVHLLLLFAVVLLVWRLLDGRGKPS